MRISAKEYQILAARSGGRIPRLNELSVKPPKYHNVRVYVYQDGFVANEKTEGHGTLVMKFDSVKEYNRWGELQMLERGKAIQNLKRQELLVIQPKFTDKDGNTHKAVAYRADFTYTQAGKQIVEDVKGYDKRRGKYLTTETFNLKWKLLQNKYPDYVFRLY